MNGVVAATVEHGPRKDKNLLAGVDFQDLYQESIHEQEV